MQDHWLIPICHNIKTNYKLANAYGFHEIYWRSFTARLPCNTDHFYFIYDQLKFIFRLYIVYCTTYCTVYIHVPGAVDFWIIQSRSLKKLDTLLILLMILDIIFRLKFILIKIIHKLHIIGNFMHRKLVCVIRTNVISNFMLFLNCLWMWNSTKQW